MSLDKLCEQLKELRPHFQMEYECAKVRLSIDSRQTGLGCNNCGPIPLPQYRFPVEKTIWRVTYAPVSNPSI